MKFGTTPPVETKPSSMDLQRRQNSSGLFGGVLFLLIALQMGCASQAVVRTTSTSGFAIRMASKTDRKTIPEDSHAIEGIGLTLNDAMMDAERRAKEISAKELLILEVVPSTTSVLAKSGMLPLRVPMGCRYGGTCLGSQFQSVPQPQTMGASPFRNEPAVAEEIPIVLVRGVAVGKPKEGSP
ncbi:MAG: hypothetical protein KBF88_09810 [Polyangiaceae bacterium]|nr:hypothetical protein [Polyangiaceae bacterium]